MKEIRDIKLDLLMGNQNPIVDLFNEITKELQIINCEVYNDDGLEFIYFVPTKNEWIFYQDAKNGEFWVHYNRYWKIFESEFKLEYEEIQAITKFLVEESLKRELDTPTVKKFKGSSMVEEVLKRELDTPNHFHSIRQQLVEEVLKRELDTPFEIADHNLSMVEEALKREVDTPKPFVQMKSLKVEEVLKREIGTPKSFDLNVGDFEVGNALKRELKK